MFDKILAKNHNVVSLNTLLVDKLVLQGHHSVRCMHAVIGKFTNLHFGILNKSEILGLKGLKVCP